MTERVSAYLDGFNIYNGLMAKGWGSLRWLDYPALLQRYMRGDQELVAVKYFTSPMTHQPDRWLRQQQYLQALEARGGIEIIAGEFVTQRRTCRKCGKSYKVPQEKRTDVNLAVHLVADAYEDVFDTFILSTADTDLAPAATYVREKLGKKFILIDPPRRHSGELANIANQHLHSRRTYFVQCQLPDPVEYDVGNGTRVRRIHRPPSWLTPAVAPSRSEPDHDGVVYRMTCHQPVPVPGSAAAPTSANLLGRMGGALEAARRRLWRRQPPGPH